MAEGVYRYGVNNDRWCYTIWVRDARGQRRKQWVRGFRTEREAQRARRAALAALDKGEYVAPSGLTVGQFLTDHWLPAIRDDVRPSTFDSYATHVRVHLVPRIGGVRLQGLSPARVKALHAELLASGRADGHGGLSVGTVQRVHATLHRALRDAVDWEMATRNAAAKARPPRARPVELEIWSREQLSVFLDHVRGDRLYALWRLAATTGMRRGEIAGLRWRDVDLDVSVLTVHHTVVPVQGRAESSTPKSSHGQRRIPLDPATVAALRNYRATQQQEQLLWGPAYAGAGDHVFSWEDGRPIHPERLSTWFARFRDALHLPRITFHGLRHTHAALLKMRGVAFGASFSGSCDRCAVRVLGFWRSAAAA